MAYENPSNYDVQKAIDNGANPQYFENHTTEYEFYNNAQKSGTVRVNWPSVRILINRTIVIATAVSFAVAAYGVASFWHKASLSDINELDKESKAYAFQIPMTEQERLAQTHREEENLIKQWDSYIEAAIIYAEELGMSNDNATLISLKEKYEDIKATQSKAIDSKNWVDTELRYEMEVLKGKYSIVLTMCSSIMNVTFDEYIVSLQNEISETTLNK